MDLEVQISLTTVHFLPGFIARGKIFKGRNICFGALALKAIQGMLAQPFPVNIKARDRLL